MTKDTMTIFYEIEREVKPFFDQARINLYGDVAKTSLKGTQRDEYIFDGYVEYFKSIPKDKVGKRTYVFGKVIKYGRILSKKHNHPYNVFEMCNLVTKE
jgi:putative transposon-encoded protein